MTSSGHIQSHHLQDAKIAGSYDLEKTIGKGHFAVVKLARHVFTGERVAVKIIDKSKLDAVSREHLYQEVICMKLVQHPHVVRLYEVIDTTHKLYLVQEWGDGGDLYDHIMRHERGLSEAQCRVFFSQILHAISYCHKLHVVHRDLKPENVIFFADAGVVKLTDFGFSNKFTPGSPLDTSCGSLAYSAPEILLGDAYDPPKVDIWSLGVILYMLVCGELPFHETNDSETLTKIMDCRYSVPPHVSSSCRHLIDHMLRRNPEERISLEGILSHPWLTGAMEMPSANSADKKLVKMASTESAPPSCSMPLLCQQGLTFEEHMEILNTMADGHVATQAEIQKALESSSYDYITATYFLLAERKLARRQRALAFLEQNIASAVVTATSCCVDQENAEPESVLTNENVILLPPATVPITAGQAPVRILSSEMATDGPEERLRRFSCILEDQEEEEDEEGNENMFPAMSSLGMMNEVILEDLPEEDVTPMATASETLPSVFLDSNNVVHLPSLPATSAFSRRSSLHEAATLVSPRSYELHEGIELTSEGVASLRYSVKPPHRRLSSACNSCFSVRHRATVGGLTRSRSLPFLQAAATSSEQHKPPLAALHQNSALKNTGNKASSTASERRPRNSWHYLGSSFGGENVSLHRRRKDGVVSSGMSSVSGGTNSGLETNQQHSSGWRYRMKRRSLPPLSSTSPLSLPRRNMRFSHVGGAAASPFPHPYSSSSDNSDSECGGGSFILDVSSFPSHKAVEPPDGVVAGQKTHVVSAFSRKMRVGGVPAAGSNNLRSSSGGNLRDQCAPIKEDEETPPSLSSVAVGGGRFHQSFSMTPTPCPSAWTNAISTASRPASDMCRNTNGFTSGAGGLEMSSRRRSDYGRTLSVGGTANGETPVRHSVHGMISYRPVPPATSAHHPPPLGKYTSASSINQSNFSLSSVASSLRGSKMMMDVIRGTFELQLHHQRSKANSSVSSSNSRQERLDTVCTTPCQPPGNSFEVSQEKEELNGDRTTGGLPRGRVRQRHSSGDGDLTATCCTRPSGQQNDVGVDQCDVDHLDASSPELARHSVSHPRLQHHSYSNPVTPSTSVKSATRLWANKNPLQDSSCPAASPLALVSKSSPQFGDKPTQSQAAHDILPHRHKLRWKVNCCSIT